MRVEKHDFLKTYWAVDSILLIDAQNEWLAHHVKAESLCFSFWKKNKLVCQFPTKIWNQTSTLNMRKISKFSF
jgi:hypothetical protein